MLYIAICDDEEQYLDAEERELREVLKKNQVAEYEIHRYPSGDELCANPRAEDYQILFLDVSMPGMNGIETAEYIRKRNRKAYIIFVTSLIDYAVAGYHVEALRYILKPEIQGHLEECVKTILLQMHMCDTTIPFDFIEGRREVPVGQIIYIENIKHKQTIHIECAHGAMEYHMNSKLDVLEQLLAEYGFLRIHQSILVNVAKVKRMANYHATMYDNTELPIPHEKFNRVRNNFDEMNWRMK